MDGDLEQAKIGLATKMFALQSTVEERLMALGVLIEIVTPLLRLNHSLSVYLALK